MNVVGRICGGPQDDYLSEILNPPHSFSHCQQVDEKHIKTLLPATAKTKYRPDGSESYPGKSAAGELDDDLMPFLEGDIVDAPHQRTQLDETRGGGPGTKRRENYYYFISSATL